MKVEKMTFNDAKDVARIHALSWQYTYKINYQELKEVSKLNFEEI